MKSRFLTLVVLLVLLLSYGAAVYLLVPECRAWADRKVEVVLNGEERGFVARTYNAPDGQKWKYVVFVPYSLRPDEKLPVILYLNGLGKRGSDGFSQLTDGLAPALWEMKAAFPFIALFPQCPAETTWTVDDALVAQTMDLLDETIATYHADPERVLVTGLSSGGAGVWRFAELYPDRFAGIAPISSGGCSGKVQEHLVKHHLPIWSFHAKEDFGVAEGCRSTHRGFVEKGGSPRFTEIDGAGARNTHNGWDFAFRNAALYDWMGRQNRRAIEEQKVTFSPILLTEEDLGQWEAIGGGWTVDNDAVVSCPAQSAGAESMLVYCGPGRDYELHLDFKSTGDEGCRLEFYSGDGRDRGLRLSVLKAEQGSGGIADLSGGTWLQAANPIAQRAMIADDWNDLRIQFSRGRMRVELNGWPLHELEDERVAMLSGRFALISTGHEDHGTFWRYVRLRKHD